MTAEIFDIQGERTVLALDTLVTRSMERDQMGYAAKLFPLAHVNAVLGCTPYSYITRNVVADALARSVADIAELRSNIQEALQVHAHDFFNEVGPAHGLDFHELSTSCSMALAVPGDVYVFMQDWDYKPLPVSRARKRCMVDPPLDGSADFPGGVRDDDHLLHLMRRQRAESGKGIGGRCIKAMVSRDGIDIRDIGDVEQEPGQDGGAATAAKASRQPERRTVVPAQRTGAKVGRNDPCPCGSGRKAKKCCGVN